MTQPPTVPPQSASVEHNLLMFAALVLLHTPKEASTLQVPPGHAEACWQLPPLFEPTRPPSPQVMCFEFCNEKQAM